MLLKYMVTKGVCASGAKKIIFILLLLSFIFTVSACKKEPEITKLDLVKQETNNYFEYQSPKDEYHRVKRGETNDLYYYADDGKRYVFPAIEIYRSWFGDFVTDNLKVNDLETLYQVALNGSVTFRPGTLMQTPTDFNVYIVIGNGQIKSFGNKDLLKQIYGKNWQDLVYDIENFYFTQYVNIGQINTLEEFPEIPKEITINQDKGLL